jgi:uncharacterized membrane protein
MAIGPVQILVIGFPQTAMRGEVMRELMRLRDAGIVRLVDMLVVAKDEAGNVQAVESSDLSDEDAAEFGAIAGALIGLGADGTQGAEAGALAGATAMADGRVFEDTDVWYAADAVPAGTTAAIALIEHRWAIPLRDAVLRAEGETLASEWLHPADLIALGVDLAGESTRR